MACTSVDTIRLKMGLKFLNVCRKEIYSNSQMCSKDQIISLKIEKMFVNDLDNLNYTQR